MALRTWPELWRKRSPDSEIALAEYSGHPADSEIDYLYQYVK
jgi:hypothetical protein